MVTVVANGGKHGGRSKNYYKSKDTFDERVLDEANKKSSQYKSNTYERLKKDGRLEMFCKLLSTAASMGYTREEACRYINQYMAEYFRGSGLCSNTLKMMLERYPDVNEAWTIHRDTIAGAAVARISQLISKTNDLEMLLKIAKAFDNVGIVHDSDKSDFVPTKKTIVMSESSIGTSVPTELQDSEETKSTIEQLMENYEALEQEIDSSDFDVCDDCEDDEAGDEI